MTFHIYVILLPKKVCSYQFNHSNLRILRSKKTKNSNSSSSQWNVRTFEGRSTPILTINRVHSVMMALSRQHPGPISLQLPALFSHQAKVQMRWASHRHLLVILVIQSTWGLAPCKRSSKISNVPFRDCPFPIFVFWIVILFILSIYTVPVFPVSFFFL